MNPIPKVIIEQVTTSPPHKRSKCFDEEHITMGEQLTDAEINLIQQFLKLQLKHVNGLHLTLQQDKRLILSKELKFKLSSVRFIKTGSLTATIIE